MRTKVALLSISALALGCSTRPLPIADSAPEFDPPEPTQQTTISAVGPGDQLEIIFYDAPELNRTIRVGPDAAIRLPYVAPVSVIGKTVEEIKAQLEAAYAAELQDPRLELILTADRGD